MSSHVPGEGDREMANESVAVICSDDVYRDEVSGTAIQCSQPDSNRSITMPLLENPLETEGWKKCYESKSAQLAECYKETEGWKKCYESKSAQLAECYKEMEGWKKCYESKSAQLAECYKEIETLKTGHEEALAMKDEIEALKEVLANKNVEIKKLEELTTDLMRDLGIRKHIAAKPKKERDELQAGQISTKPEERSEMSPRSCGGSTRKKGRKGRKGK